jgi:uncharacterized protein YhdP
VAILQRWRGGRIDLDGGTLRLPGPGGSANPFILQVRRASLRRSDQEWSLYGLVFLPEGVGRIARVAMKVSGDLSRPAALSGSLRLEARRLLFSGCRDLVGQVTGLRSYLPRAGSGDLTVDLDFADGTVTKANGEMKAAGLVFDPFVDSAAPLRLERLQGQWRLARHGSDWRLRIGSLEVGRSERKASVTLDAARSGQWVRGTVQSAPLQPVIAVARWLTLPLDLAGIELKGLVHEVGFDWNELRPAGEKLQVSGGLEDVALVPPSGDFTLSGFDARVLGNESLLRAQLRSDSARLELAQSRQYPLADIHLAATLRVGRTVGGWVMATDGFTLEHEHARLSLSGVLRQEGTAGDPTITAHGTLTGADIALVERLLGDSTAQAFGAAASRLTAGRIRNAEFGLRGPISELPFGGRGEGFTGSLTLQGAILSGGHLWPDAEGIDARIEWRGARIQATIFGGHAGPFQVAAAHAQWDAAGSGATRLTGHITGRLEDAIAWMADHPRLQQFAPQVQNVPARGEATFDFNVSVPSLAGAETAPGGTERPDRTSSPPSDSSVGNESIQARVVTSVQRAELQAVAGLPPMQELSGSFVFDGGHLQRSSLTGTWLGGPVTVHAGEHTDRGIPVFSVQAQGVLSARQLASAANAPATAQGSTDWTGELQYLPATGSQLPRWRMRADSSLVGVLSSLPEPFAKRPGAPMPAHVEVSGEGNSAQLRFSLGDRLRSAFALRKGPDGSWLISRGALRLDALPAIVPAQPVVLVQGDVIRLDLPAYVSAWQRLRWESLPPVQVRISAAELLLGGQSYPEVSVQAEGTDTSTQLQLDSASLAGNVRWPVGAMAAQGSAVGGVAEPAEVHLRRLALAPGAGPGEEMALVAALAPVTRVSVDQLLWQGRSLGQLTATLAVQGGLAVADDLRLVNDTHTAQGLLHCQTEVGKCQLTFQLDSSDAAATLRDFGFRPDVTAARASLGGAVQWRLGGDQPWLERLDGTLNLSLAEGATRPAQPGDSGRPFALFSVPALLHGLGAAEAARAALPQPLQGLHFARLEADFQLHGGEAQTSNLHFDGDAEILMRGHTGLLARDYDQQVFILRGEDRLPEAIRRFGATPRVAAAWLSLRELFEGNERPDRSRAVLRLQGSWDDPMVVAAN